jgi:hypothetical protein
MAFVENKSSIPLLSALVPLGKNDGQRPIEKLAALSLSPNQPPAANTTSKHKLFVTMRATTTRHAFTLQIISRNNIIL